MMLRLGVLLLLILVLPVSAARSQTIKLGTLVPEGSPWHRVLSQMGDEWAQVSDGRVTLRIYAGGVAGDDADMVRKIRIGQLQAAALTGQGLSHIASEVFALQMPMMFASDAELNYVRRRYSPRLESILEKKGFKLLFWGDGGWVRFFAKSPVIGPGDLKPLKLFLWSQNSSYIEAWREAGFHPISMAATDIHAALLSGLIDAFTTTPMGALSFQWFTLAPHMTDIKWAPLIGALVVHLDTWRRIPEGTRERIMERAAVAEKRMNTELKNLDERAIEAMLKHGLVRHSIPEDVAKQWERAVRAGYPRIIGSLVPASAVADVERLRAEYRSGPLGRK